MNNYIGSELHKENLRKAAFKGREILSIQKAERIKAYYENPNKCKKCEKLISYERKNCSFCNSSCAAFYNNKLKPSKSKEQRQNISNGLKNFYKNETFFEKKSRLIKIYGDDYNVKVDTKKRKNFYDYKRISDGERVTFRNNLKSCKVEYFICEYCGKLFTNFSRSKRKTCSRKCRIDASIRLRPYQNGTRKPQKYFNKWINEDIWLDSSWEKEIAELLDNLNIRWERPNPINWIDNSNIERLYYPDFFLNDYGVYLDPKNPFCMEKDKEKMNFVEKIINIVYGDKQMIKDKIEKLWKSIKVT